jgi:transketolase
MDKDKIRQLEATATRIRIETLKSFRHLGFGHVGGATSMIEALAVLYWEVMQVDPQNPKWEDRDWLVLSKGHSGPGLYATLALKGFFPMETLSTLNTPNTTLPSHCDRNKTPGIDMSTGSLGQGMSMAIGVALGNRLDGRKSTTFLILGDGECDEGQVWEGALFAAHHKVDNLVAFIDYNKQQLDGYTYDICDLGDLACKFSDFNWYAQSIDGHDVEQIYDAIARAREQKGRPSVIVLNTIKGKDVSFAEGVLYNHHMFFNQAQLDEAIGLLEAKL